MRVRRLVVAGAVVAVAGLAACDSSSDAVARRFCRVASSERLRGLEHLDFADTDDIAAARSQLALLRAAAPADVRHDLTRLLDGIDQVAPATAGAGAGDDLAGAARRVERYLHDTCGTGP